MICNYCLKPLELVVTNRLTKEEIPYSLNPLTIELSAEKSPIPNHWKNDVITIADRITSKFNSIYSIELSWSCKHDNFHKEIYMSIYNGVIDHRYEGIVYDGTKIIKDLDGATIYNNRNSEPIDFDSSMKDIELLVGTFNIL